MRSTLSLVAVVLAALGAATACSSSSIGGGGTSAPNACQVLTTDLVTPVIGSDAALSRSAQPNPHETQCQYKSSTGAVDLELGDWSVVNPMTPPDTKSVAGLGDEAYVSTMGLVVRKGEHGFNLDISLAFGDFNGSAADDLEAREAAAEQDLAPKLLTKF
jgi:hypothetical protein